MSIFKDQKLSRRDVLRGTVPVVLGSALYASTASAQQPAALTKLDEKEPVAAALGYVADAKKVDPAKNPTFKAGQNCANCLQLQGKAGEKWRPCSIFPKKLVDADGWCRVWVKKPGST